MFGISSVELLIILVVAMIVIPAKNWPDVFKFFAKLIRMIRGFVYQIQDKVSEWETEIDKHNPIDDLTKNTFNDMMDTFAEPVKKPAKSLKIIKTKKPVKKSRTTKK